ncbi:AbrB/MazE/SpoVT family DNA-binding domain-containing protein [Bacillus cereus]
MKKTGIIRRVDAIGRIVIPKEVRRLLNLNTHDKVEIYVQHDHLVVKRYNDACFITGKTTKYPFSFCKGKLLLSSEGVERLQKELETYQQTQSKLFEG